MAPTPKITDPQIQDLIKKFPAGQERPNNDKDKIIKFDEKIRFISPQPAQ